MLRANFYKQVGLGHAIILSLFDTVHDRRPDYMAAFLGWEPVDNDPSAVKARYPDESDRKRYVRSLSMYLTLLHAADFPGGDSLSVELMLNENIRETLARETAIASIADCETRNSTRKPQIKDRQKLPIAVQIYKRLWDLYDDAPGKNADDARRKTYNDLFPISPSNAKPYFEAIHRSLLEMLGNDNISGPKKLTPFKEYHDPRLRHRAENRQGR